LWLAPALLANIKLALKAGQGKRYSLLRQGVKDREKEC
jgi:hypothetical protein